MEDISFSKRRKNRGYTYLCTGSAICVSLLRAPQYSTFACCVIPVLTLIVLRLMLDDIDDISFTKRRNFLIVSWMSISVYCIPTRDTHITRDMCMGIHISRGYTYHCDTGSSSHVTVLDSEKACRLVFLECECTIYTAVCMFLCFTNLSSPLGFVSSLCTVLLYP